ncbi:MAG: PrsW family glutamic-type intramembrane protease [Pseudomonadota bacterium]
MPFKSSSINLLKSPIFYMVMATGLITVVLFGAMGNILQTGSLADFGMITAAAVGYLLLIVLITMYLYSRTDKTLLALALHFGFVALIISTPLAKPYFLVFREILPGSTANALSNDPLTHFVGMFFAAGLCEELMKVTLVLFGAYIAVNAATWRPKLNEKLYDWLCVRGPLDGLMMGLFGGAGFIFVETAFEYVPRQMAQVAQATGSADAGLWSALMLLLPRTIGGMVGHMAWAGITGYFIGLTVIRPVNALKIIGAAWVGTSALHALWNSTGLIPGANWISVTISAVLVVACLLKAKQLEQSMGRSVQTYGSIVVDHSGGSSAAAAAAPAAPAPSAPAPATSSTQPQASVQQEPSATAENTAPAQNLRLIFDQATIPILLGRALDLSQVSALAGIEDELRAEVTQHPTRADVLGLKNLGKSPWVATLRDGSQQRIVPERNIRLANGVTIDFGAGLVAEVMIS